MARHLFLRLEWRVHLAVGCGERGEAPSQAECVGHRAHRYDRGAAGQRSARDATPSDLGRYPRVTGWPPDARPSPEGEEPPCGGRPVGFLLIQLSQHRHATSAECPLCPRRLPPASPAPPTWWRTAARLRSPGTLSPVSRVRISGGSANATTRRPSLVRVGTARWLHSA